MYHSIFGKVQSVFAVSVTSISQFWSLPEALSIDTRADSVKQYLPETVSEKILDLRTGS